MKHNLDLFHAKDAKIAKEEKDNMTLRSCERIPNTRFALEGLVAAYLEGVSNNWLKAAPEANPAMLEMFRDRDRRPLRDLLPWSGEFAGKYLTGAMQVLRLTGDAELKSCLQGFVREMVSLQAEDGYLGPWPADSRLTGQAPNCKDTWDAWGHYHVMLGLLLWHEETGDAAALACARRIGDLFCDKFLGDKTPRLVDTGSTEMNLAPAHSLSLLHRATGEGRYLELARQIVDREFAAKDAVGNYLAGNYLEGPLAGQRFFELPKPRWESLHPIMALVALYPLTGEERYRTAFERIWHSIADYDRHNNGGFSSGEQAQGNPYHQGAIETCCTIAWLALTVEMLRLTGDPLVADELELATLNSVIGMHSHTGRWATYNTPMDGVRKASTHDIIFQAREGSPELNCCSVNSARGFGLISDWALCRDADGLVLNWYGPGTMTANVNGCEVTLTQDTDYPYNGHVSLIVSLARTAAFTLKLRIPRWSSVTAVCVNGAPVADVAPGSYLALSRQWRPGDRVEIDFDFGYHGWIGEQECAGKASLYRGPLLLAYDRRFNDMDPDDVPALDADELDGKSIAWPGRIPPMLLLEFTATDGRILRLCDFGSAGEGGTPYLSWLHIEHADRLPQYFAGKVAEWIRA